MAQNEWRIHSERLGMGTKVFFNLERIPSRYGTGYKAKMKRRETRTAEECARLDTRLSGMPHKMMVTHCEAVLDAMFKMAAETGCICRLGDYMAIDPHMFAGISTSQMTDLIPEKGIPCRLQSSPVAS